MSNLIVIGTGKGIKRLKFENTSINVISHSLGKVMKCGISGYINELKNLNFKIDGIVGLTDSASLVAAIVARELNLISPSIEAILKCQNKYLSRISQQKYTPEACPKFALAEKLLSGPVFNFPVFIKPIKSSLSFFSYQVRDLEELKEKIKLAKHLVPQKNRFYETLIQNSFGSEIKYANLYNSLIAEEVIEGDIQITLDGYVCRSKVGFFGITKSNFLENGISFSEFVFPFSLGEELDSKIYNITKNFLAGISFDNSLFNIEFKINSVTKEVKIIEINSRPSGQFISMIKAVSGENPLEYAANIALGIPLPSPKKLLPVQKKFRIACCFILRQDQDQRILRTPSQSELEILHKQYPNIDILLLAKEGKMLSNYKQDSSTFRYAQIKIYANSREEAQKLLEEVTAKLKFKFKPVN